ncbi:MAG TPA: T9SS type A sorting domain-containing protein, partial [Nitrosopumilaceae archaeon]|nr:T9SS type A sorting domain-containing protein [Nitrosopumilaceae archaeon]
LSTSYINGPMNYLKASTGSTTLNFPIGKGADCRPVSLTVNHTTNNSYTYTAQLYDSSAVGLYYTFPITVDAVSAVHFYSIGRTNAVGVSQPTLELSGNQTIQIFFGNNDVVRNGGTLTIVKNTYTATTSWIDIGGTGGPVFTGSNLTGSVTSTSTPSAFNSFSTFALGDEMGGGNPLPIKLLYFDAKPEYNKVDLSWATSTESNNSYFTIEKSSDAVNFEFLLNVNTQALNGNSDISLYYSAEDLNPFNGTSFYRLKETNLDGSFTFSKAQTVNFNNKKLLISVYPNPTSGALYVSGININETSLYVEWYDVSGRRLLQQTVTAQNGVATLNVYLKNGSYFLRAISSDGNTVTQNVIINK